MSLDGLYGRKMTLVSPFVRDWDTYQTIEAITGASGTFSPPKGPLCELDSAIVGLLRCPDGREIPLYPEDEVAIEGREGSRCLAHYLGRGCFSDEEERLPLYSVEIQVLRSYGLSVRASSEDEAIDEAKDLYLEGKYEWGEDLEVLHIEVWKE